MSSVKKIAPKKTVKAKAAPVPPIEKWKTMLTEIHNSHIAIGHLKHEMLRVVIEGIEFDLLNFHDYDKLPLVDSPFGRGTETLVDKKVRNSREYTLKNDVDKAIHILGQTVVNNVLGSNYCSIPYKVIVYEKGSFFAGHVDTPEDDLLYTLILVLPSEYEGGDLVFGENFNTNEKMFETDKHINFVLFRINCSHRVEKVTAGHRVSISFKVYKTAEDSVHHVDHRPVLHNKKLPALRQPNVLLAYPNIEQITELLEKSKVNFIPAYGPIREDIEEVYSEVFERDSDDEGEWRYGGPYDEEDREEKNFELIAQGTGYIVSKIINIGFEKSFVELGGETGNEGYEPKFKVPYVKFILINPKESYKRKKEWVLVRNDQYSSD